MRIASLLPSCTEIACALGLGAHLVARSHECDYPAAVRALPAATRCRVDPGASSAEIDAAVREAASRGTGIYQIDEGLLAQLAPDLILTQDLCEVCAVDLREVRAACARQPALGAARIVALDPTRFEGVLDDIRRVATAAGADAEAAALLAGLQRRVDAVSAALRGAPRPRTALIEWASPLMVGANWMPDLVALAGGEAVLARAGVPSAVCSWDALAASAPEVVVVIPCGFDLERAAADLALLRALPGWDALPAARAGRVYAADGNAYFNRPGPRLVDSVELLAHLLHPDRYPDRHPGTWR